MACPTLAKPQNVFALAIWIINSKRMNGAALGIPEQRRHAPTAACIVIPSDLWEEGAECVITIWLVDPVPQSPGRLDIAVAHIEDGYPDLCSAAKAGCDFFNRLHDQIGMYRIKGRRMRIARSPGVIVEILARGIGELRGGGRRAQDVGTDLNVVARHAKALLDHL